MKKRCLVVVSVVAAAAVSLPADAQTIKRKPGLWEMQYSVSGPQAPNMNDKLAQMPPEQRAQMEQMMKQHGMSVGTDGAGGVTMHTRYCLTAEEAKQEATNDFLGKLDHESKCENKSINRSATEVRFSAVCRNDEGEVSEFNGRLYDISPEHFATEMRGRSPTNGETRIRQNARWLAADCGNVK